MTPTSGPGADPLTARTLLRLPINDSRIKFATLLNNDKIIIVIQGNVDWVSRSIETPLEIISHQILKL